jgi:hypothetical protein
MQFAVYILLHSVIDLILLIKFIFSIYLLIAKYEYYMYTFMIMIVITSIICDIIPIIIFTIELIWSLLTKRIVSCWSQPPFYGDGAEFNEKTPLCGFFRPYYLNITSSYLVQTFVMSLILSTRGSSLIPNEILALFIWTIVLFSINIIITIISCIVTIK